MRFISSRNALDFVRLRQLETGDGDDVLYSCDFVRNLSAQVFDFTVLFHNNFHCSDVENTMKYDGQSINENWTMVQE